MKGRARTTIGIPAYRERAWLPAVLEALSKQTDTNFELIVCVNQSEAIFGDPAWEEVTSENLDTLSRLKERRGDLPFPLRIIDAVHPGTAPSAKVAGVGWARRRIFDEVCGTGDDPLCISLDADTFVPADYVALVKEAFARYPNAVGLAAPYYHPCPQEPGQARRLLRYEIYMRYYQLSLWRIGSPYAFLPLGSAMAFRGNAYRRAGGIPPRQAGEDFYFLQQLRKTGPVIRWLAARTEPASRPSDRVPFGTGPLVAEKDLRLQEARFPFYPQRAFDILGESYQLFPKLYHSALVLPLLPWLPAGLSKPETFAKMRRNMPDEARFVKACHERFDGLRTLQFVRNYAAAHPPEQHGIDTLLGLLGEAPAAACFQEDSIEKLNRLRDHLAHLEAGFQKAFMAVWDVSARW